MIPTSEDNSIFLIGFNQESSELTFRTSLNPGYLQTEIVKSDKRVIVVIAEVDSLIRVCHASSAVRRVNIGGLHDREGRRRRLPYVFLSDSEGEDLKMLAAEGVEVTARDVPSAKAVPLSEIL